MEESDSGILQNLMTCPEHNKELLFCKTCVDEIIKRREERKKED